MTHKHSYEHKRASDAFRAYASSRDAKIEQDLLQPAISAFLPKDKTLSVLDAACGTGWLAKELFNDKYQISACDISPEFISELKKNHPAIPAAVADISQKPPYPPNHFGCIILNMASHDLKDLRQSFQSLATVLMPEGTFIMTVANPYYSYPVGRWKRGLIGRLLSRKPSLKLLPYNFFKRGQRKLLWNKVIPSYFYTLPEYLEAAKNAGLALENFREISSDNNSAVFDRAYQLYRFPMILMLVFRKK